ncbi:putative diacylglycerol kinase family protein [Octadecabacter antarcticus 307]|uniref:Diacylglycerol kinase n=1 Tax=Octadecabacter antarcticus 307 TaxID=391626 RepID=M9R254_9RHOB|nr:diacylglycerol kinase [Octadecabacter antarcticus]AGI66729.1 putative diacylglycerol kinase family protein [Octadecabacter antarcticus 307]
MGFFERLKLRTIWSCDGIRDTWLTERSFRQWVWANIVSGGLGFVLLDGGERALILVLGLMVLVVELLNTAVERTVDLVSLDRSDLAKQAKDAASGAVMLSAIAVGVAWVVVLVG